MSRHRITISISSTGAGAYGPEIAKAPGAYPGPSLGERGSTPSFGSAAPTVQGRMLRFRDGNGRGPGASAPGPRPPTSRSDQKAMSPPPGMPPAGAFSFSGFSDAMASVV